MNGPFSPAPVWRLKFKSNATFKQMPVQEIKTFNPCNAWHQEKYTVWHLEVIFSSSVLVTDKMNLASSEKLHINPHHTNSICCSPSPSKSWEPLYKLLQHNTIHPRTLTNMIKTLSDLTPPSPMLSGALTGSCCWLTAWMCLIINRADCATTEGLWWQKLQPRCWPLPSFLPKCHLNEIGPRSSGIRHCIITYSKTLIEHFIKRLALRFCQGGHYREETYLLVRAWEWGCVTLNSRVTLLAWLLVLFTRDTVSKSLMVLRSRSLIWSCICLQQLHRCC